MEMRPKGNSTSGKRISCKKKNTTLVTIFLIEKNYTYIYLHNAGAGTTATHTSVKNTEKKKIIARSTM